MAGNASRRRKLAEEQAHPLGILADVGVYLAIGPLQVHIGEHCRSAMSGPCQVDHIHIVVDDEPIEVDI